MKLKKVILAATVGLSLLGLTACTNSNSETKNVVTMKGWTIEAIDVYNEGVKFPNFNTIQLVQNLTFSKVLEQDLGNTVSTSDVDAKFNQTKTQYGAQFDKYLSNQGLTEATYKETIRLGLLETAAVDKDIKETQYTDADVKSAWANYYPEVDTYIYSSINKSDAQKMKDQASKDFATFKKTADSSNLEQKFDSTATISINGASPRIPKEVFTAAVGLTDGKTSDIIPEQDPNTGTTNYYFVYMIKNPGKKDSDMSKYTAQIKNFIKVTKENDTTYTGSVFKGYLTKHNVTVKEKGLSNIFSNFTGVTGSGN